MTKARSFRTDIPTPRTVSPYNLLQEQLRDDPWKLLVACIMLNRTHNRQVKEIIWKFFELFPDDTVFQEKNKWEREHEVKELIAPLGFKNRRFEALWNMSSDFYTERPDLWNEHIYSLRGVGKYAADSFMMFCGGYLIEGGHGQETPTLCRLGERRNEKRRCLKRKWSESSVGSMHSCTAEPMSLEKLLRLIRRTRSCRSARKKLTRTTRPTT
jgi:methyl-CpG-binding domain protein 4